MNLEDHFPEIYRYRAQETGRVKLISGLAAACAVCAAAAYTVSHIGGSTADYLSVITFMQFNMLVFYGAICAAKSVTQEKAERTWDFQRLTPRSSFDLAAGKFLGAPVYAWFLFACMLPAALFGVIMAPQQVYWLFFSRFAVGLSCALLAMAVGLLASAYDDTGGSGMGHLAGPLVGLAGIGALNASYRYLESWGKAYPQPIPFYGYSLGEVQGALFLAATFLAFGAWAFLGARYRIGRDLLEKRKLWRLPAFLAFLAWYMAGFCFPQDSRTGGDLLAALLMPCLVAYMAAFLSGERREYWRRWLAKENAPRLLNNAPAWLKGAAAVLVIAGVLILVSSGSVLSPERIKARYFLLVPLFMLRDLFFLQWCRFSASRRPEMMALAYLALAYALPGIMLSSAKLPGLLPFFIPSAQAGMSPLANLAGPAAQVLVMGYLLFRKIRKVEA
jgi:hypothetical protein